MLHILLSSQMLFQLLNEYLICPFNLINSILLPYLVIWEISSTITTTTIWSHSGIILAVTSDLSTYWLTKSWNVTGSTPLYPIEYYGSLVKKKKNVTLLSKSGRCISKHLTSRENTFLTQIIMIINIFILYIPKIVLG